MATARDPVGPILQASPTASAVAEAIAELNSEVVVSDHGSYLRLSAPGRCRVTRAAIEGQLGRSFHLPGDLEKIMPAFTGRLTVSTEEAVWEF